MRLSLATHLARLPPAAALRREYLATIEGWYHGMAYWLATIGAWRALWPDDDDDEARANARRWTRRAESALKAARLRRGKRERHFFSLIGCFGLWAIGGAALGEAYSAGVAVLMVMVTVGKTLIASLFGEPLIVAGLLGLGGGGALLALLLRFVNDESLQ